MDAMSIDAKSSAREQVSIHAPVMDAIYGSCRCLLRQRFNPSARDGRDGITIERLNDISVSIHAPVMDAIKRHCRCHQHDYVSIHAPVMDAIVAPKAH